MSKLDTGIIALLGLGVGAFVLSKVAFFAVSDGEKEDDVVTIRPTEPPTTVKDTTISSVDEIITTDPLTGEELIITPTAGHGVEPAIKPIVEQIITVEEAEKEIFNGQLEPTQAEVQVQQIAKLNPIVRANGLLNGITKETNTSISFFLNHSQTSGFTYSYSWTFGDGSSGGNKQTIKHAFDKSGIFNVRGIVKDSYGNTGTAFITVSIKTPQSSFGDVSLKLTKTSERNFSLKIQNNRTDIPIDGKVIWIFTGNPSRTFKTEIFLQKGKSQSSSYYIDENVTGNYSLSAQYVDRTSSKKLAQPVLFKGKITPKTPTVTPPETPVTPPEKPLTPKQPATQLFKGEVAGDKNHSYHPTAFSSTYLLVNYRLPSKAKKLKYARIYFKAKADNFGFDGATATVTFNGSTIGTLKWSAFDDNKSRKLDIKVTSKMKLSSYNVAKVTYKHNNNFFGQPLASGFHVVNANLYVEYEY